MSAENFATSSELEVTEKIISAWAEGLVEAESPVESVERGDSHRHNFSGSHSYEQGWYMRLTGESKEFFSLWFELGQRTLQYESYFMPAPLENAEKLFAYLLGKNFQGYGASFAIGPENAIFLVGRLSISQVNNEELDRILGSIYAETEQHFSVAMRIGFGEKFKN